MKNLFYAIAFIVLFIELGCDDLVVQADVTAPSSPRGLSIYAGDQFIELTWEENPETDVEGYNIFVSSSTDGMYQFVHSTTQSFYFDDGVQNGSTYYYRISAYDRDRNESSLSHTEVSATPRPEGYHATLSDFRLFPDYSGYDFSTYSVGRYDDSYTDIYFEYYHGAYYMDVWDDTEIQDMGYTNSLDEIVVSPTRGWSPSKDARLIDGHTYVIRTWDSHFAKIRIISHSPEELVFDWAYQLQGNNPLLKMSREQPREELRYGLGPQYRRNYE